MLERYTLSTTSFPSQSFDETGCDYFLFSTPGNKDYISIDPEILSPYFTPSQVTNQYGAYPLIVQPLAPYMVLVRHIFTTLQYTFKTLQELFRHNKHVLLLFY